MSNIHVSRLSRKEKDIVHNVKHKPLLSRCARYSNMAYLPEGKIKDKLLDEGAKQIFIYANEGMLAFMAEFNTEIVVSFRGIGTAEEFKTIMQFWKKDYHNVKVHAGFSDSVDKFSRFIINDINTISSGKKIIYTGHSFGGAMAFLLTLHHKPDIICTFGAPKAGGGPNYLALFDDVDIYRVQAKADFVPMLPPSFPIIMDYMHVGEPIYLDGVPHPYESHRMKFYTMDVLRLERQG